MAAQVWKGYKFHAVSCIMGVADTPPCISAAPQGKADFKPLLAGDVALRIPEHLAITLDRVFQDEAVAELLTTNKLSELACLTLYLMYEKKAGKDSFWAEYIKVKA